MEDVIRLAVASMHPIWGQPQRNLETIASLMERAAAQGARLLLCPEMCLTGYDDPEEVPFAEKMQVEQAQEVPGPATDYLCKRARDLGIWVVFGMPEKMGETYYNTAVAISDQGELAGVYRKIHLPNREPDWATRGTDPVVLSTPWGPVGIGICYDTYNFPELIQYARAKGARLFLNPTAICWDWFSPAVFRKKVETHSLCANIVIASANLVGKDLTTTFTGCSNVVSPTGPMGDVEYLGGHAFGDSEGEREGLYVVDVDLGALSRHKINSLKNLYAINPRTGATDRRADLYSEWYRDAAAGPLWREK